MRRQAKTASTNPEVAALVVSDETAPALLGMTPRAFREAVLRQRVPHVKLGARIVVTIATLHELSRSGTPIDVPAPQTNEPSVDDMLASLGHVRSGSTIRAHRAANTANPSDSSSEKTPQTTRRSA